MLCFVVPRKINRVANKVNQSIAMVERELSQILRKIRCQYIFATNSVVDSACSMFNQSVSACIIGRIRHSWNVCCWWSTVASCKVQAWETQSNSKSKCCKLADYENNSLGSTRFNWPWDALKIFQLIFARHLRDNVQLLLPSMEMAKKLHRVTISIFLIIGNIEKLTFCWHQFTIECCLRWVGGGLSE